MMEQSEIPNAFNGGGNGVDGDELFKAVRALVERANEVRATGDTKSYQKLMGSVLDCVGARPPPRASKGRLSPRNRKVLELLEQDWIDVATLSEATGVTSNHIHIILGYLRSHGADIHSKTIKRYHIPKE